MARVLQDVRNSYPAADILVVNDGSTDQPSDIARNAGVMVLDIPYNIGYGGALQTGFRFATEYKYDYVITMDGDAQLAPSSATNLIREMDRSGADVVIGSRFLEGNYRMPLARRTGVWLFSRIARLYTGVQFTFSHPEPELGWERDRVRVDGRVGARKVSHSTHTKLLFVSVWLATVATVVSMVGTILYAQHLAEDRRSEQIAGCERANLQRAYINKILEHHPDFVLPPIAIPDCSAIIK